MRRFFILCAMALGPVLVPLSASGFFPHHSKPHCEPGYTLVEEVCHVDVVRKTCKPAPAVKKTVKWVYDCKSEDFCVLKCPLHGHHRHHDCAQCSACVECSRPMTRNLLIKKAVIVETPSTKCVVEFSVEKVPHVTYRKVPCAPGCPTPGPTPGPTPVPAPESIPEPKTTFPYMPPATSKQPALPTMLPAVPATIMLPPGAE